MLSGTRNLIATSVSTIPFNRNATVILINVPLQIKCSRPSLSGWTTGRPFANQVTVTAGPIFLQKEKTSRAMKVYLERAREHEEFMKQQQHEFEIGKRHLANMMGEDPENFSQEDIDRAIEYLFPSGIFDPKARPLMKAPQEIFPKRKAAEFDESGRPHHSMFFTGRPNFFQLLFVSSISFYGLSWKVIKLSPSGHCRANPANEHLRGQDDPEAVQSRSGTADVSSGINYGL